MTRKQIRSATLVATLLLGGVSAAHAVPAVGLSSGNALFDFDTATPGTNSALRAISGLSVGETIYSIDFRPATGLLYGLGTTGSLYTVNVGTGVASLTSRLTTALSGNTFDIAFNPTVDRLRIVSDTGQNLRVDVSTGATTTDGSLAYGSGDANAGRTPAVLGAAYTNQVAGAASTTLYDLDGTTLAIQTPPNNGTLVTTGNTGVSGLSSFDIDANGNVGYAATSSALYQVNLTSGAATSLGNFARTGVTDFAILPQATAVPEPMTLALLGSGVAGLVLTRRRRSGPTMA